MPAQPRKKKPSSRKIHRVRTYGELENYANCFLDGHLRLVILIGGPGLGKSETFRRALEGKKVCWMEGNATPFGMYERLFKHRNLPIVIDDVDGLCFDRGCISLLKSLCHSVEEKHVSWSTNQRYLEGQGLPAEFKTRSKVVVITNNWRALNRNVSALEDRGHVILFEPSVEEVHRRAGAWFKDREIHDWFGENLHRVVTPSFRDYIRAAELKACKMDWTTVLGEVPKSKREELALALMEDDSFENHEDRAKAFEKRGGGCRSTFFNYKRRLEG